MSENVWLISNRRRVDTLIRQFEEYRMMGSYGGKINFGEGILLVRGLVNELERVNKELEKKADEDVIKKLKARNEILETEIKHLKQKIQSLKGE